MVPFNFLTCVLAATSFVTAFPSPPKHKPGCGEVNVIFTGLPPYHPLVTAQGFDPAMVDKALRGDAAAIIKAGYNLRVVLEGPEQPLDKISEQMNGIRWYNTGVGYGVRGSRLVNVTERFTDIIQLYREKAPFARTLFDYSPNSALWALQTYTPLSSNCTDKPGKDLGFKVFCDICSSPNSTTHS